MQDKEKTFSKEEIKEKLREYVKKHPEKFSGNLSDDDLDEIVGGISDQVFLHDDPVFPSG